MTVSDRHIATKATTANGAQKPRASSEEKSPSSRLCSDDGNSDGEKRPGGR